MRTTDQTISTPYKDLRFAQMMRDKYPLHEFERASPILHRLRSIKSSYEIDLTEDSSGYK
jgi:Xaa-Pro aminopeptidase